MNFFVGNAAQEHLLPYLPDVLEQIQNCLSSLNGKGDDGEMCILHTQTLGKSEKLPWLHQVQSWIRSDQLLYNRDLVFE